MKELKITDSMNRSLQPGNVVMVLYHGLEDWTLWFIGTVTSVTYFANGFSLDLFEFETRRHHTVYGSLIDDRVKYDIHMVLKLANTSKEYFE